ncbi:MAG: hypothetical protein JWM86_1637 [Thermoleophilia bacterium]|nr:hypothetical protein [Thermoleophilia bacterium]
MSFVNDISGAMTARQLAGQQPVLGAPKPDGPTAAQQLGQRFGGVFQSTFSTSMATVYERGAAGEFDDPTLRLQEQAALERLRIAQQAAGTTATPTASTGGGIGGDKGPSTGADAAPDAPAAGSDASATAMVNRVATTSGQAEQREIYALRVRQSEARLKNISSSLAQDFPKAAGLASASTGTWDPGTFVPKSRDEVESFAQRMVIDATESAARLEIVKTQLDAARFELAHGGGADVQRLVTDLEAGYARQKAYVDKLATIVNTQSGGKVADAGADALNGVTLRDAGDIPVHELAAELRASGMDDEQVKRVIGATELGVEQEKTPGGSPRLKAIAADMTATLMANFNRMREQHREEFRRQENERAETRRQDGRRAERRQAEQRQNQQSGAQRAEQRQQSEQAQAAREQQRHAEFQQWLQTIAAAREQHRSQAS